MATFIKIDERAAFLIFVAFSLGAVSFVYPGATSQALGNAVSLLVDGIEWLVEPLKETGVLP